MSLQTITKKFEKFPGFAAFAAAEKKEKIAQRRECVARMKHADQEAAKTTAGSWDRREKLQKAINEKRSELQAAEKALADEKQRTASAEAVRTGLHNRERAKLRELCDNDQIAEFIDEMSDAFENSRHRGLVTYEQVGDSNPVTLKTTRNVFSNVNELSDYLMATVKARRLADELRYQAIEDTAAELEKIRAELPKFSVKGR